MQELTFEQVDVVSGGSSIADAKRRQAEREEKAQLLEGGGDGSGGFVGSTAHRYATAAAVGATIGAGAGLFKCTVTGPAYFFCVAKFAGGGAIGGMAGQALLDYTGPKP